MQYSLSPYGMSGREEEKLSDNHGFSRSESIAQEGVIIAQRVKVKFTPRPENNLLLQNKLYQLEKRYDEV